MKTLAVTGHRWGALAGCSNWWRTEFAAALDRALLAGYRRVLTGGALGVDQIAAEMVAARRQQYPDLALWICVPHQHQEARWSVAQQDKYGPLLASADVVWVVSPGPYAVWKLHQRNAWMMAQANAALAVLRYDRSGGTAAAVAEARKRGKPVYQIDPVTKMARWILNDGRLVQNRL